MNMWKLERGPLPLQKCSELVTDATYIRYKSQNAAISKVKFKQNENETSAMTRGNQMTFWPLESLLPPKNINAHKSTGVA